MEQINSKYNTEFTNKLVEHQHIFYEIFAATNGKWELGCGSYLFDGREYKYCDLMYEKQELLYNLAKKATRVLEIGVYMGHSLLIMLLANPSLKITAIDIEDKFTRPGTNILNKYFNNAITFIHKDSLSALPTLEGKFDLFHIDGFHDNDTIEKEFGMIKRLNDSQTGTLHVIFDDQDSLINLQNKIHKEYKVKNYVKPNCKWNNVYFELDLVANKKETIPLNLTIDYRKATPLCSIMKNYGSDKGSPTFNGYHNYTLYYYALLNPKKDTIKRVFELGLGTNNTDVPSNMGPNGRPGASLRGWKDFFPNANIYGADIDSRILFTEDRIQTFFCDQTSTVSINTLWNNTDLQENFDLIIDDGLHSFAANVCFFENSYHKLNPGGIYIIEDILNNELPYFEQILEKWRHTHDDFEFQILKLDHTNKIDNTLIVIQKN